MDKERETAAGGALPCEAERLLAPLERSLDANAPLADWKTLCLGFDLGTTNSVLVALNEEGEPVGAVMEASRASVRDGVVVDYLAAIDAMRRCLDRLEKRLGRKIDASSAVGAAAYPPGISERTAKVCANVVEALGIRCAGLYEEPTAASDALGVTDGALVDIGGGTTGISILRGGEVVYSADEPTGGTHMTLVLAGAQGIEFDAAEKMKRNINKNQQLVPLLRPTLEKMSSIIRDHLEKSGYYGSVQILVAGGGAALPGAEEVMSRAVGCPVRLCPHPLMVTPAGIALRLWKGKNGNSK